MKIAVVGGGWFGCHVAVATLKKGHEVTVFERGSRIFTGASSANQERLHLGYHYPRSFRTRCEISLTHNQFVRTYPTRAVRNNFFAISNQSSIDLQSYTAAINPLPIVYDWAADYGIRNVENNALICTRERVIDTDAARQFFEDELASRVRLNTDVSLVNLESEVMVRMGALKSDFFDVAIDCTSGALAPRDDLFFEPAVMAEFDGPKDHFALTVMDGNFPCLYPTSTSGVWRVSHVLHTACGAFADAAAAADVLQTLDDYAVIQSMTQAMSEYYPDFVRNFQPRERLVKAVRTKLKNNNASRQCHTAAEGRVFRVFSGKICAVFLVENEVLKWLLTF